MPRLTLSRLRPAWLLPFVAAVAVACAGTDPYAGDAATAEPDMGRVSSDGGYDAAEFDTDVGDWDATDDAGAEMAEADAPAERAPDGSGGPQAGRHVIRTGHLTLVSDDPASLHEELVELVDEAGGFVEASDLTRDADHIVRGSVVVRVPPDELDAVVTELDALAVEVPVRRLDANDVTDQIVDLGARIDNQRRYEKQLQQLLEDVQGDRNSRARDLLEIYERLTSLRGDIERLEAQRAGLHRQVDLARLNVTLQLHRQAQPVGDPSWSLLDVVRDALDDAAAAGRAVLGAAVWLAVVVAPFVAPPAVAAWLLMRRRRRRNDEPGVPDREETPDEERSIV